ncbi:hypothetical protein ACFPJ1_11130 [Kribbella qitaiheensis]|uniref:hypothetical protein n=1 Tax=Kribbella qitaiheensis TaxID=1544730 RepID=UPI00360E8D5A
MTDHLAALFKDQLPGHPWEKAMVTLFADLVRADGNLRAADLGCGPGVRTRHRRSAEQPPGRA